MPEEEHSQAHVYISGRVQGVNYRYYTRQQANQLGLVGWVRNVIDGRVEAIFQGEHGQVLSMLEWCKRGPPSAKVSEVEVEWQEQTDSFLSFEIKYW